MRDHKTDEVKRHVGQMTCRTRRDEDIRTSNPGSDFPPRFLSQGVKIKMDDAGNILIRRYSKSNVYVKSTANQPNEETAIGADILKLPGQAIESEKIVKLFDMKKFQSNVNRELRRAYPDRRRLETQCLSAIAFVKSENDILDCPMWVLIINVVAMDMLKSKLPPVQRPVDIKNRPRIPIPDEDPYSVAGNGGGSSGSSGFGASGSGLVAASREHLLQPAQPMGGQRRSEKPPKLPPRDNLYATHEIGKPDYDDIEDENRVKLPRGKSDKGKDNKKYDDPYYCGLRARVPNFVKSSKSTKENNNNGPNAAVGGSKETVASKRLSIAHLQHPTSLQSLHQLHQMHPHHNLMAAHQHHQQLMWHARSYESGIDTDVVESPYSHMYGRVPLPTRGYIPAPRAMYIGEWD
uniref:MH2 domain-containing protein n=1 Tax=Anopheles dirus TaxID=7168 RepID=A0A182NHY8_9DIPT